MAKTSHKLWCCSSAQKTVAPRDTGSLVSFKNKSFQVRQCALPLYECKPHKERKSHYDILLTLGGTSLSLQSAREYSPDVEKNNTRHQPYTVHSPLVFPQLNRTCCAGCEQ